MQLKSLKVFCDVVTRHSFSKAASDNEMTQSGASQAVQQLEEFLRVQLIDRSKRPFVLTAEGNAFYGGAVQLVRQFETLAEEVRSISQEVGGRATLAAIYSVGLSYLPHLQKQLKERHPQAELRSQLCHPDDVYRLVEQGSVDFGLVSFPQQSKTIIATHWREEPMLLVAPATHRLAKNEQVSPEDLGLEQLVAFAPNLRIRHEIDRYLRQLGITMRIAAELDNIDSVKHALEVESAVAFLPEPTVKEEIDTGSLVALKCPWLDLTRPLGVIQRRNCMLGRTARGVLEMILADADKPNLPASATGQCAQSQPRGDRSEAQPENSDANHKTVSENNKRQVAVT
jgi:DNA-binding transcriptional LysR family regulator